MYQYLHKYFAIHKSLVLPGVGSFYVSTEPAQLDFVNKILHPPVYVINYSSIAGDGDETLYDFLIKETGETKAHVINAFNSFTELLGNKLQTGEPLQLHGIGTVLKKEEIYFFDTDKAVEHFFTNVSAERVIRQNAEHNVRVGEDNKTSAEMHEQLAIKETAKDKWWVSALLLAVIGVAAITYYYYSRRF